MITCEEAMTLLSYEPETGQLRWRVSRGRVKAGAVAGYIARNGYVQIGVGGKLYLAHRLAWLLTHGSWPSDQIDHANGNPADNRISNLRKCSNAENSQNKAPYRNNTSAFVGVTWNARKAKWQAQITLNGNHRQVGLYATPEQAHVAYLAAKADLHSFNPIPRCAS